jgi:hypothetical protein
MCSFLNSPIPLPVTLICPPSALEYLPQSFSTTVHFCIHSSTCFRRRSICLSTHAVSSCSSAESSSARLVCGSPSWEWRAGRSCVCCWRWECKEFSNEVSDTGAVDSMFFEQVVGGKGLLSRREPSSRDRGSTFPPCGLPASWPYNTVLRPRALCSEIQRGVFLKSTTYKKGSQRKSSTIRNVQIP